MTKSLPRPRALLVVGCRVTLGAVAIMAIACAKAEPTAPPRHATAVAMPAVVAEAATSNGQGP